MSITRKATRLATLSTGLVALLFGMGAVASPADVGEVAHVATNLSATVVPDALTCTLTITGRDPTAIEMSTGVLCITGGTVASAVTINSGASIVAMHATIDGALTTRNADRVIVCQSSIHASVSITGTFGFVLFGNGGVGSPPCLGNSVRGPVTLGGPTDSDGNTGGLRLGENRIQGPVKLAHNTAPAGKNIRIDGNHIQGPLECNANDPLPTDGGTPNVGTPGYGQCAGLSNP